ncbi:hypothetical protein [Schaedlerella sp.]|uniref:hypothetical protein n=1 Tax=Schaedlerella sp. TaxID=2676057 RepID=UPI003528C258
MDIGCLQFQLEDTDMQRFLLSGMLVFADKVITKEDSKQIKEWIVMTKVGQLFLEEKIQYGQELEKRVTKDVTKRVTEKVTKDVTKNVTKKKMNRNSQKFCSMPVCLLRRSAMRCLF